MILGTTRFALAASGDGSDCHDTVRGRFRLGRKRQKTLTRQQLAWRTQRGQNWW